MRVLLLTQYFWPETFVINALAAQLQQSGVQLTVITGQPNYPEGQIFSGYSAWSTARGQYAGVEIVRVPLVPRGRRSVLRLTLNYLSFIASGCLLAPWLLRGRDFDAVFVYAPSPILQAIPALWLARLKRAPIALWVQDLWPESLVATGFVRNAKALAAVNRVVRAIYALSDRLLVPSRAFAASVAAHGGKPGDIYYLPNPWIDESTDAQGEGGPFVDALAADIARGPSIVFAGNLGRAQALDTVVDAAERLQQARAPARLFLIGSGSLSDWLKAEIQRRKLKNVVLAGRFPSSAMPRFYAAATALLVSLRDEPIFSLTVPSKVQGYLAAGRPIVAALNGEGARVVEEARAGVCSPAGDAVALAAAIARVSAMDADERAEMGENARRYARENFSLGHVSQQLAMHLTEMLAAQQRKPS